MEASAGISEADRATLIGFLEELQALLGRLLAREPSLLAPRQLALLRAAWNEIEEERRFEQAIRAIEIRDFDGRLEEHGLHQAQLGLKVGVFKLADEAVKKDENRLVRFYRRSKRAMALALKAGNVVLGSVADAVPGVGAIQEFKDAAEVALDQGASVKERILARIGRRSHRREDAPPELPPEIHARG